MTLVPRLNPRIFPDRTSRAACGSVMIPAPCKLPLADSQLVWTDPTLFPWSCSTSTSTPLPLPICVVWISAADRSAMLFRFLPGGGWATPARWKKQQSDHVVARFEMDLGWVGTRSENGTYPRTEVGFPTFFNTHTLAYNATYLRFEARVYYTRVSAPAFLTPLPTSSAPT